MCRRQLNALVQQIRAGDVLAQAISHHEADVGVFHTRRELDGNPDANAIALFNAAGGIAFFTENAHALHTPYWWIKCAVGVHDDDHPLAKAYHRLLVWDIMKRPRVTRWAERVLDPVIGKSMVLYFTKPVIEPAASDR